MHAYHKLSPKLVRACYPLQEVLLCRLYTVPLNNDSDENFVLIFVEVIALTIHPLKG